MTADAGGPRGAKDPGSATRDLLTERDGDAAPPLAGASGPLLPVLGTPPRETPQTGASCAIDDDGCITCGDVAVALTVVEVGEFDAVCRDDGGRTEVVATELVGPLSPGDQVLVHAKVALERLGAAPQSIRDTTTREGDVHALR